MTTYNPAEVERLIKQARDTEYPMSVPSYRVMADQLEAARAEIARLTEDLNHATAHEGDWLSKASRRMCETVLGERDALRSRVRALESELATLRDSVVAALSSAGPEVGEDERTT